MCIWDRFEGGWSQGADLGDLPTLISLLEKQSIDGENVSKQISKRYVKNLLVNETKVAIDKGVFGVPSIIIDDNLFWGNDQMEHIELLLAGKDPLNREKLNLHESRPRGIDRKAFKEKNT